MGSLAAGYLGSRRSKTHLLATIYGLRAVVITAFVLVPVSGSSVIVFGSAMGVLWLSTVPLTSGIVAAQFGTAHSGTLFGVVFLSHQMGAFVGVFMAGVLADRTGSYAVVWWIAVGLGVVAAVLHLIIDEEPAPSAPARTAGAGRFIPAGAATVIVVGVLAGLVARPLDAEAAEVQPQICLIHTLG